MVEVTQKIMSAHRPDGIFNWMCCSYFSACFCFIPSLLYYIFNTHTIMKFLCRLEVRETVSGTLKFDTFLDKKNVIVHSTIEGSLSQTF